ncbi:MAG TPA: hypothetical protein VJS65_03610, partial [Verrucomicrobiae bacterium]|nr:hypothetical protein [Verrucomicrobiae bacterium]
STRLATLHGAELTTTAKRRSVEMPELIHLLKGDLDWVVMKCLEKDRTRRYETATGLAADLKRHLDNEPVVARPPSAAYKLQKAFRRHKLTFAAAGAVMAALITGLALSTWQMFEARKAQQETEVARKGEHQQRLEAESAQKVAETQQRRADAQARKAAESQAQSRRLLYAADMNLAHQALKVDNLGKARQLLDRHRPQSGEDDLRGWEWRYLWQLSRGSALVTLTNRAIRGRTVSFSSDGARMSVGWEDGRVELWDVPGRRLTRVLMDGAVSQYAHVVFSPIRNLLAATSEPKVISLYDLDAGQEAILWRAPAQGAWDVRDLAFSQDGSRVVIYAGATGQARPNPTTDLHDTVWVVNVASLQIESRHATVYSHRRDFGAARLSPDNRRLYLARSDFVSNRYSIQCLDALTGQEFWQTEPEKDHGLTALTISPDGRTLASGSGYADSTIRVWDTAAGRLLVRLEGHTGWVGELVFAGDGQRLISAASDQSIRFWDASQWTETQVLRGNTGGINAVAISERAHLIASTSKAGDLVLWQMEGRGVTNGYRLLPEDLRVESVLSLDQSRVLLLPPGRWPELIDFKRDSSPRPLPEIGPSTNILGWFATNLLFHWNGTNQILVRELQGTEFVHRGAISISSALRPVGFTYNPARRLVAWTEGKDATSVFLESLATPGHRIELKSDVRGIRIVRFSVNGDHLGAATADARYGRVWKVETAQMLSSAHQAGRPLYDATFAAGGRVLVVAAAEGNDHVIAFHDVLQPDREPRRIPGRFHASYLHVSPDDRLVASPTSGNLVRLFDSDKGELSEPSLHGRVNAVAFSPDGRSLLATTGGAEAVKLWDVSTRQELLTLSGAGSFLRGAKWTADGDVILAGVPWQAWRAPSWEEIAAAEGADGRKEEKNRE